MRAMVFGVLGLGVFSWLLSISGGQTPPGKVTPDGAKPVTTTRTPWTTGTILGSPEPAPAYRLVPSFANHKFDRPVQMVALPGSDRLFVVEQGGKIFSWQRGAVAPPQLVIDVAKQLTRWKTVPGADEFENALALAFHPQFAKNQTCYLVYTVKSRKQPNLENGSRLVRLQMDSPAGNGLIRPETEELLLSFLQGGHNGCDLHFGPDGMLYISTGDATDPNPPDKFRTGQDLTDLLASILRIDVDHPDAGLLYGIPRDNPFVGQTQNGKPIRGEIWSYGYRNAWRMSFDRVTGQLWVGDVGWELWELVHQVQKGHNGGWSLWEGPQAVYPNAPIGPTPVTRPAIEVPHSEGASMTGGYVYRGKKFPELIGHYVFGDWVTKRIWAADVRSGSPGPKRELVRPTARVVAFGQDQDGELYVLDHDDGSITTFATNEQSQHDPARFPRRLSETGLFADIAQHILAPGVRRFEIQAQQWQDYADAEYYLAVPGNQPVTDYPEKKRLPNNVSWHWARFHFPANSVLVKTLSLELVRGQPDTRQRIETQLLHFDGEMWVGYTYAWNDTGTDAELVPAEGAERVLQVRDPIGANGIRQQTWTFFGRSQCMQCHHSWAEYTLAFNAEQLNRPTASGEPQLLSLMQAGYLERRNRQEALLPPYSQEDLAKERRLADPHDVSGSLSDRAKAYLHVNCGHCHRFGGGGGVDFELQAFGDWNSPKVIRAVPQRGNFGIDGAKVLEPGHRELSTIYLRMAKFGSGRMPHIGSEWVDERGLQLIGDWIDAWPKASQEEAGKHPPVDPPPAWRKRLQQARALASGSEPERHAQWRAEFQALPPSFERDLVQGYLPPARTDRLGSQPKPGRILALKGDPVRGQALYRAERSQCMKCHQLQQEGVAVGPDLSRIGESRSADWLLESLLEPSKRIDAAYASYAVVTADGQSFSGLRIRQEEARQVFKKSDGTEVIVPTVDLERVVPLQESIMPAGLLAEWTPQEAADLLAFLKSLRGSPMGKPASRSNP